MTPVKTETSCRSCGSPDLEQIVAFGATPLADRLLRHDQLAEPEPRVELTFVVCRSCSLAQISETVDPSVLFFDEYPYYSSVSPSLMAHFRASAESIADSRGLSGSSLVVEAASNDGYMLRPFLERGIGVLGVDPAKGPAQVAIDAGIPTVVDFFDVDLARRIRRERGAADVFLGNNVLAHVPDLNGFVQGISQVLAEDGVAVIEVPYVVDLVDHCEFDTIYHQHLCYFSVTALVSLCHRHGLSLNDVDRVSVHGGSLRLFIERNSNPRPAVKELLETERSRGFDGPDAYRTFAQRIDSLRVQLRSLLDEIKNKGGTIAGYGAAAKAATLMAYCGIDSDDLTYVCDLNEYKHGRFMGGNHIPVVPPTRLTDDPPDYVLVLAWNFADEIMAQNQVFAKAGGRFIVPVPQPRVVS